MRVDSAGRKSPPQSPKTTDARTAENKQAPDVDTKQKAVRVGGADQVKLSPEATLKSAQARLEAHVHDELKAKFAAAGIDMDAAQGQDWSPDATAHRIFDFASGMIGAYRNQHPELSETAVVDKFETLMRGAVDKGYGQAIEVLRGFGASDEVLGTAKATIDKVHSLFDDFFAGLRGQPTPGTEGTKAAA